MGRELAQLWERRFAGEVDAVSAALALSPRRIRPESEEIQWRLLAASLARYAGNVARSERDIRRIEGRWAARAHPPALDRDTRFHLRFQKALNAFVRSRYAEALPLFIGAAADAPGPLFAYSAKCNVLWCLEYLGLPTEEQAREIDVLESSGEGRSIADAHGAQMEAFRIRASFRARDYESILALDPGRLRAQARWAWLWCLEVLIARGSVSPSRYEGLRSRAWVGIGRNEYGRETMDRTFLGTRSDSGNPPASEAGALPERVKDLCDRFYLWTWRWIAHPGPVTLAELKALKRRITTCGETLGADDYQQWRNASLWLALFEAKGWETTRARLDRWRPFHGGSDPHYEAELGLLERLFRGSPRAVARDPEWRRFPAPVRARLSARRGATLPRGAELVVDRELGFAWNRRIQRRTTSERVVRLLAVLEMHGRFPVEEAMRRAMGLRRVDPAVHGPTWNDLLARTRRMLPAGSTIRVSGGWVERRGNWKNVIFLGPNASDRTPATDPGPPGKREARLRAMEAAVLGLLAKQEEISRVEIDSVLQVSRAGVTRLLQRMIRRGAIRRKGRTKGARYRLAAPGARE